MHLCTGDRRPGRHHFDVRELLREHEGIDLADDSVEPNAELLSRKRRNEYKRRNEEDICDRSQHKKDPKRESRNSWVEKVRIYFA